MSSQDFQTAIHEAKSRLAGVFRWMMVCLAAAVQACLLSQLLAYSFRPSSPEAVGTVLSLLASLTANACGVLGVLFIPVLLAYLIKDGRSARQDAAFWVLKWITIIILDIFALMLLHLLISGMAAIDLEFLTSPPGQNMSQGGIFPAIIGTLYLTIGAMLIALPLGVSAAIYLSEYATRGRVLRLVRLGISNLAGVPSIVFGLFGLALFCIFFGFGTSLLAGSLTLGLLILPTVIEASEEALRQVPSHIREASYSVGATRWQTIRSVVLPAALPGILSGSLMGLCRAAGETAPIMFTAATFFTLQTPGSLSDEVMALPYHVYVLATSGTHIEATRPLQYGTVLVLTSLVLGLSLVAIAIRSRFRKAQKW